MSILLLPSEISEYIFSFISFDNLKDTRFINKQANNLIKNVISTNYYINYSLVNNFNIVKKIKDVRKLEELKLLPKFLTHLTFKNQFNQSLDNVTFPNSLTHLIFKAG